MSLNQSFISDFSEYSRWSLRIFTLISKEIDLASDKTTKLIPALFNKEKYVLHVRNLKLYLDLGMKLA